MTGSLRLTIACVLLAGLALGQTFEAISVKPSAGGGTVVTGGPGTSSPGQFTIKALPLIAILVRAYDLKNYQLQRPAWVDTDGFDIVAKVPSGTTVEQFRVMLQNLLAERFHMAAHHETKNTPAYELLVANGRPRLQETEPEAPDVLADWAARGGFTLSSQIVAPHTTNQLLDGRVRITGRKQSMPGLALMLDGILQRPVLDRTGLKGNYDFVLDSMPELFTAIQEQLGLRLQETNGQFDLLVIDRIERLTAAN